MSCEGCLFKTRDPRLCEHNYRRLGASPFYISKLYAAKNRHLRRKNPSKAYRLPSVFFLEPVNFQHAPCHTRILFTQPRQIATEDRVIATRSIPFARKT